MKTTRDIFIEVITHLTEPQLTHKQITITPEEGVAIVEQKGPVESLLTPLVAQKAPERLVCHPL